MKATQTKAEAETAKDFRTDKELGFIVALKFAERLIEKEWSDTIESLPNDEIKEGKIRGLRIALDKIEQIQDSVEDIV